MTNYLLSIDRSIKNTGFTLWENKKPILIKSYDFKKYNTGVEISKSDYIYNNNFNYLILNQIEKELDFQLGSKNSKSNFNLIIERGFPNMKGSETQDHLRGFIAGQFNKLLKKDMLISPKEWQNWYLKDINNKNKIWPFYSEFLSKINKEKWNKELSINLAKLLIKTNNWNITISNHDEADSLLIGWYYLNKENK